MHVHTAFAASNAHFPYHAIVTVSGRGFRVGAPRPTDEVT
jgi:hypothetical protein